MQTYVNRRPYIPEGHPKTEKWKSQQKRMLEALLRQPMTRLQISAKEGIPLQNICRYAAHLKRAGMLCIVRKDIDPLSQMPAEYLSADPRICRPCNEVAQLTMFD